MSVTVSFEQLAALQHHTVRLCQRGARDGHPSTPFSPAYPTPPHSARGVAAPAVLKPARGAVLPCRTAYATSASSRTWTTARRRCRTTSSPRTGSSTPSWSARCATWTAGTTSRCGAGRRRALRLCHTSLAVVVAWCAAMRRAHLPARPLLAAAYLLWWQPVYPQRRLAVICSAITMSEPASICRLTQPRLPEPT